MLNKLIEFSLKQRGFILTLALVCLVLGYRAVTQLPVEVLPDLTKPTVTILTESRGLAPEEVESLVTIPLENTLMGVSGVTRIRTTTDVGLSLMYVEFDWGSDIYRARQLIQERLNGVSEDLPEGVVPYMTPVTSLMGEIMLIGIIDPTGGIEPRNLRTYADWTIAKRLQSIPGVAEVLAMGGGVSQLQILPRPDRMLAHKVSFDEIVEAAENATSNTTGGFLINSAQEIMVRNLAMTMDLDAIGQTVVRHENDRPLKLQDVATIQWGVQPMRGDAAANGYKGVLLSVTKSPGFDTLKLTKLVEDALDQLKVTAPEGVEMIPVFKQSDFIDLSIDNLKKAIFEGMIMVVLILFLFLLNVRITLITLTAIPLSLGIAVIVFRYMGVSVNSMTLGGFAVAIGMVVDDAIVDVENVFRRLRENVALKNPKPRLDVIARASREVRSSILYATILIVLVFIPLLALSGVEGRLFSPIAIATIVSMAASFVVSLTVIPVLCSFLLRPNPDKKHKDVFFVRWLKSFFKHTWLKVSLRFPLLVMSIAGLLVALAVSVYPQMSQNFLPAFREPTVLVATTTAPGTSLKQTTEMSQTAQKLLLGIPGVEMVGYRAGRAERGDHVVPVSTVEFDIRFTEDEGERDRILKDIREIMDSLPGTFSAISGPLADRVGHMLSGVAAPIAIKIYGPDLLKLRQIGKEIEQLARTIPGLEQARGEPSAAIPQLRIEVDRARALAYGITPGELNTQLGALLGGMHVGEIYNQQKVFDLVLRLPDEWREDPERLKNIIVDTKSGQRIPLKFVANIRNASGPNNIMREDAQRRFVVSIQPNGADLVGMVDELRKKVSDQVNIPEGYFLSYEGEYVAQKEASKRIAVMSAVVFTVIAVLLLGYFRTHVFVLQVLADIPLALVGGVLFTFVEINNVSIATLVGFIAVAGIAARNSIMLISHYLHLMKYENEEFTKEMIERGTLERLVPVLMTALSAGIALIPLVLAADKPGKEILHPVAVVIVGGLVTSTFLGLLVTPAVFWAFGREASRKSIEANSSASQ